MLQAFFLSRFLGWLPALFGGTILILATLKYADVAFVRRISYRTLIAAEVALRFLYAILETLAQRWLWAQDTFSRLFLTLPLDSTANPTLTRIFPFLKGQGGYFFFYVVNRFWLGLFISLACAWIFYRLLLLLKKYKESFFESHEPQLGFLTAFIAGWPGFVLFIPYVFASMIIVSVIRMVVLKERKTTMGAALLLAAFFVLLFQPYFMRFFGLWALKI